MENSVQMGIEMREEITTCAFTGHRELGEDFCARTLKKELEKAVEQGVHTFYNGMAMGFDLIAAETVLKIKKKHPQVRLIACIPCYGQEKYFSEKDKKRYVRILKKADEQVCLSEHYYRGCMQMRDRYMADRADMLIAYCKKTTGGAAYTVSYFCKKYPCKRVIFL